MDKVLLERFIYKDRDSTGPAGAFYAILKEKTLSFHLRKGHKRHTPLKLFKVEEITAQACDSPDKCLDGNANKVSKYYWQITANKGSTTTTTILLYCVTEDDRDMWLATIDRVQRSGTNGEVEDETRAGENNPRCRLVVEQESDTDQNPVYNSAHTTETIEESVGIIESAAVQDRTMLAKTVSRVRSHSLSELIHLTTESDTETDYFIRSWKSNSAPPVAGGARKGFRTVDKLMDVHSLWCRQLVRWIEN